MNDPTGFRLERVEKLLQELQYEVTRGMMEGELDEEIGFRFAVPVSKKIPDGAIICEFRTRPMPRGAFSFLEFNPRLKVVK